MRQQSFISNLKIALRHGDCNFTSAGSSVVSGLPQARLWGKLSPEPFRVAR